VVMQTSGHNLFCFIYSQTTYFNPTIFLKEFAFAGPKQT
jgi:hypothetical protein